MGRPVWSGIESQVRVERQIVARFFRFVEKKRGQRRTGSNLMGSVGEALFCGALFLLGVLSLTAVLASYLLDPDPAAFSFGVGRWLGILVMASFVIIGGGGLIWTVLRVGTSAERLSAMARQASEIDLGHQTPRRTRHFPAIPSVEGLTNSPGIELAYRLPPAQSPGWRLFATTIFSWSWTSVTAVLTVWAATSYTKGQPEWLLTALLVPLIAVAIWSLRMWIRQIWIDTGMGPTTIEITLLRTMLHAMLIKLPPPTSSVDATMSFIRRCFAAGSFGSTAELSIYPADASRDRERSWRDETARSACSSTPRAPRDRAAPESAPWPSTRSHP